MTYNKTRFSGKAVLFGTAMFIAVSPAFAGFEWTPPAAPEKVMMTPATPKAAPVPVVQNEPVFDKGNMAVMPEQNTRMMQPENQIGQKMPGVIEEEPVVATVSPVTGVQIPEQDMTVYEEVQGFGSDIPLVTAMSQIVPANYAYSVDDQALLAKKVSWTGGMPWNKALMGAVEPLGLDVVIVDKTVWIREEGQAQVKQTPAKSNMTPEMPVAPQKTAMTMVPPPAGYDEPTSVAMTPESSAASHSSFETASGPHYPRRNPIPMMMKAGDGDASAAPEQLNSPQEMADMQAVSEPIHMHEPEMMPAPASTAPMATPSYNKAAYAPVQPADNQTGNFDPFEIRYWEAEEGMSLKALLTEWGNKSGTQVRWHSQYDYRLPQSMAAHATFPDAVTRVLTYYEGLEPRPIGRLHPNLPDGPAVLVIENHGVMTN